jgi:hypothetical protein
LWTDSDAGEKTWPLFSSSTEYFEPLESVLFGKHKYIRGLVSQREELYDLSEDPAEQVSIATRSSDLVQAARELLESHNQASSDLRGRYGLGEPQERQLDPDTLRELRSLGYIE